MAEGQSADSDEDLFLQIAVYNNESEMHLAESAFALIYGRHSEAMYSRCEKLCRSFGCPELTDDLHVAVFRRAFDKADTYDGAGLNLEAQSRRTLAWLGKIARNLLLDHARNPERPSNPLASNELDLESELYSSQDFASLHLEQVDHPSKTAEMIKVVAEAFDSLDQRTKSVLLETYIQRSRTPSGKAMRRGSGKLLAEKFGTSEENIRRIRHRGIQKINEYVHHAIEGRPK